MINVPPCLASEELRAHASLTLPPPPALYKANFFNSQISLSFLQVHHTSSSFIFLPLETSASIFAYFWIHWKEVAPFLTDEVHGEMFFFQSMHWP